MNDLWQDFLSVRSELFYGVGLVLALITTVHALLTKRDVAAAVGWIALAWFAPIMGSVAYALLGVNRVRSRARASRPGRSRTTGLPSSTETPLSRGIDRITRHPVVDGNLIEPLHDGDEGYPAMLAAITGARSSVGLSSYIFRDDAWGGRFIAALSAAQARGVAVRVLIDGIGGNWLLSPAFHRLRRAGVPARRFLHSPLPWRMPFLNLRSHKKILVIDGTLGFTGGLNIGDENVLARHPRHPVRDLHFRVAGPVVAQLVAAFAEDWHFAGGEALDGPDWFPPDLPAAGPAAARTVESGPDEDIEKVEFAALQAVSCARSRVSIMTPYFLPDERLVTALALAAMRGVEVDVVVPARSNRAIVDWGTRANSGPLLREGVRIWRSPSPFHHTKAMVVDDDWCLIGSANWDMRSFRLNFELCMEVHDRDLSHTLHAAMHASRGPALTLAGLRRRPMAVRLRDAAARLLLPYL